MNWILSNLPLLAEPTLQHLRLALVPIVASFLIAVPLGRLAAGVPWLRTVIVGGSGLLYTIPALPLFVILPIVLGTRVLDETNLVVALTIYGVALMVRSAADGFAAVDRGVLQAADAMG